MKSLRISIFSAILILVSSVIASAQWKSISATVPTPNAASLGLYGEIPVSYFTGVPNISVPIYEFKGSKIGLSIQLNYNASGLRPELHPGWVGNGWSLSAGGVITRKANGNIDEYSKPFAPTQGYYFSYNNLNNSTWATTATTNNSQVFPPAGTTVNTSLEDADTEPDEFNFNFMGYSGKFFLDQTGTWQVQCDKNLKVVFNASDFITPFIASTTYSSGNVDIADVSKTFGKFTIIDEQGNQYIFGSTHPATDPENSGIEYSDVMVPASGQKGLSFTATSWYLTQVVSADGLESINLNYERGPFTSYIGFSMSKSYTDTSIPGANFLEAHRCTETHADQYGFNGTILSPVYLTSITMPSQSLQIDFNKSASNELSYPLGPVTLLDGIVNGAYTRVLNDAGISTSPAPSDYPSFYLQSFTSPNLIPYFLNHPAPAPGSYLYANRLIWLKLDNISIKNTDLNFVERTISFSYNNNPQKRLTLNSLTVNDKSGLAIQSYGFYYNPTPLPNYLTTITDHWGYNNNKSISGTSPNFDLLRAPDPTGVQTQAEILTSIKWPTGGTTQFTYQPNRYGAAIYRNSGNTPVSESGIAGGLRIKQIQSSDNNGTTLSKNYYYVNGFTASADPSSLPSSGVLDSKPVYSFVISGTDLTNVPYTFTAFSSNPVIPLTINSTGTHIGYSNVVEQSTDGSYSVYQFTNHDNGYGDQSPVSTFNRTSLNFTPCNSLAFERGKLFHQINYSALGAKVSENTVTFSNTVSSYTSIVPTFAANAVYADVIPICDINNRGAVSRTAYLLNYAPFLPVKTVNTIYDLNGANTTRTITTNTTYDQYKNILAQDVTNSDGTIEKATYRYAYSFVSSNVNNPYNAMRDLNMNDVVEKVNSFVVNNNEYVKGGEIREYQLYGNHQLFPSRAFLLETASPIPSGTFTNSSYKGIANYGQLNMDAHYVMRTALAYDNNANLTTMTEKNGRVSSFIYDYNKAKVVAKVLNANNVYQVTPTGSNIPSTNTFNMFIPGAFGNAIKETITVQRTGPVTVSYAYNNPYISGNNYSTLSYQLTGNNQYQSGSLCAATNGATSSCGATASTATINNVAPGTYVIYLTLNSMVGFQNYYGFTSAIQYPTYQYYADVPRNEIAYTSFEYNLAASLGFGTGNWSGLLFNKIVIGSGGATGSNYYTLTSSTLTTPILTSTQKYYISYWSKNGVYTVTGSLSYIQGVTLPSGWTYFRHLVSGVTSSSVTGTGYIDELRLYPIGAQMTTYSYEPLVGLKTVADLKSQLYYYTYDNFQRLSNILDQSGNIMKHYDYNYAVTVTKPVINSLIPTGLSVYVDFTPVSGCTGAMITYTDLNTSQTSGSTGSCSSNAVTVPSLGHTYQFKVTCYSALNPGGTTSVPVNITL